jgi:prepilin-type N-terminal cleavage/methylation domain-containing protein
MRKRPVIMSGGERGFTLLEVMIVITIMAGVYAIAFPNFNLQQNSQVSDSLGRLSEDVRAAFDTAVLSGKPHRMVFTLATGEYILERSDHADVYLSAQAAEGGDLSPEQEKEKRAEFEERFRDYQHMAGETYKDSTGDVPLPPSTPVLKAKKALQGPSWAPAEGAGWSKRTLGDYLIIKDIQTEHLAQPVVLEEGKENARVVVHFFPRGYVERTVMHIYYKKNKNEIDTEQNPYTVKIDPYLGIAEINSGLEEVNVHSTTGKE